MASNTLTFSSPTPARLYRVGHPSCNADDAVDGGALPAMALDILFTVSIALAIMVLMASIYANRPLDFGVFPTVLLLATL